MKAREEEISNLIGFLSEKTEEFEKPKLILIGGYALRAFVPYSRSTRDRDFALKKDKEWISDEIKRILSREMNVETFEKKDTFGYLRCMKMIKIGRKSVKVSLDFMEGEVRGRKEQDIVVIDDKFIRNSAKTKIIISEKDHTMYVPSYSDYLILKIVSARPSDVRDIATLVLEKGVPEDLEERTKDILPYPNVFKKKLKESIIPIISDKRFIDSWRGTFLTTEFDEKKKVEVLRRLKTIIE
ncbi:MAG: hypothetical protein ACUVTD_08475 [Nitrososphaerales archaeon]